MSTATDYPHLVFDDDGTVRIGKSRYKVKSLAAEHYHYGWSAEEILRQHPDLRPEQVYAALTYFYDHSAAIVRELEDSAEVAERRRDSTQLSRTELLQRRQSAGG